jgi:hypothetical protein
LIENLFSQQRTVFQTICYSLVAIALFSIGCGKRHPPLPPLERIPQRTEQLSGFQRGNQIILSWPAPQRNASENSLYNISRVDIYRLAEPPTAPLPLTEEQFATRSTLIGSIPEEMILKANRTISYTDSIELGGAPVRLRYALRYVNASGQRATFSNFLLVEPSHRLAMPPTPTTPSHTEDYIKIEWQPPTTNIDNSTPPNILGYNIYRVDNSGSLSDPLNSSLITDNHYADRNFSFGQEYSYIIRTVSLGSGGLPAESLNSNKISITPKDIFPPSAPEGIRLSAAPKTISIFFAANSEKDVAGYNIYRSTNPDQTEWTKLNTEPITRTTFTDDTVQPGVNYYYYLTAIDIHGNVSPKSEIVSETVPQ